MSDRIGKLKEGSEAWCQALFEELVCACPDLVSCNRCGRPHKHEYVCMYCGEDSGARLDDEVINVEEWIKAVPLKS